MTVFDPFDSSRSVCSGTGTPFQAERIVVVFIAGRIVASPRLRDKHGQGGVPLEASQQEIRAAGTRSGPSQNMF